MNKYKICAYAICKNEEKFVDRWYERVKEADIVIVGDTGSTDNTIDKLAKHGVIVHKLNLIKFRFDEARNKLLELLPEDIDICVSSDLDEVISLGWRKELEQAWRKDTTRASCQFNWSHNKDGSPAVTYLHTRIHQRHNYKWLYPTHEIISYIGNGMEKEVFVPNMYYDHYPDKNKNRSFNLPLLQLAVVENPQIARNYHYLGREYLYIKQWDNCINTLIQYLSLPNSTWKEERAASMRFIGRAYKEKGDLINSKIWLYKAMSETPNLREPYIEMALLAYYSEDYLSMYYYASLALRIKDRIINYATEHFAWDHTPYDLMAISSYWLGQRKHAVKYSKKALAKSPDNKRLIKNHEIYTKSKDYPINYFR